MENINAESMKQDNMEENLNNTLSQQSEIRTNQQSIQNNSSARDKSDFPIGDPEENESQKTFQRKPQFRLHENSKRRFF